MNSSGFSILIAIGTIWVLLILVTSLAISYIRESRLSRYSYDEIIVSAAAEWQFEYAMLKIKNHRDGFQDTTFSGELDGNILNLSTLRSARLRSEYQISAASTDTNFTLSGGQHLIIPLFADSGSLLPVSIGSKDPILSDIRHTSWLKVDGISGLSWSITAMSGSQSVSLWGVGNIDTTTNGSIRVKVSQCYNKIDGSIKLCSNFVDWDEEILYSYDNIGSISDFLRSDGTIEFGIAPNRVKMKITDPYFMLYNSDNVPRNILFTSTTPFTLPTLIVRSIATQWDSSQIFQFVDDKGKYYDALKYGVYNTGP